MDHDIVRQATNKGKDLRNTQMLHELYGYKIFSLIISSN